MSSRVVFAAGMVIALSAPAPCRADGGVLGGDASLFRHPDDVPWWLSGQANWIFQGHPAFPAKADGHNSLVSRSELSNSFVVTVYTGYRLGPTTDMLLDVESAGGRGLSNELGLGAEADVDAVRNPSLSPFPPYVARWLIHQTIPLGAARVDVPRSYLQLAPVAPARRIELYFGKLSTVDFFDQNAFGSDSHFQFMNWTTVNNGAYDYAADTRGYTYGLVVEYIQPEFAVRFGEMMMPSVANGPDLDWDLARDHAENVEVDVPEHWFDRVGVVRALLYANHANMGSYSAALRQFRTGVENTAACDLPVTTPRPCVETTRTPGRLKLGVGLNVEEQIYGPLSGFARGGWSTGDAESFAYTEAEDSAEVGLHVDGVAWRRTLDNVGLAYITNGLSVPHREYLAAGGLGFLLGDGFLKYGREHLLEGYYNLSLMHGLFAAVDVQYVWNPGYNQARGPVFIGSARIHLEL